jgi:hypothetical protein
MTPPLCTRDLRASASEIKFVVDGDTGSRIRQAARECLAPDPHASGANGDQYLTTTLYFDTTELDVYHRRGSYRRAKFRVRRYGDGEVVFLERKLRTAEVLSKRRTTIPLEDLPQVSESALDAPWPGQWFQDRVRLRKLSTACQVSYLRTARVGRTESGPIRLTVDDDVRAAAAGSLAFSDDRAATPVTDRTIVELKFAGAMPALFRRLVEDFVLAPARVSKYRLAVEATREPALTESFSRTR